MLLLGRMDVAELMSIFGKEKKKQIVLIHIKVIPSESWILDNSVEDVEANIMKNHHIP